MVSEALELTVAADTGHPAVRNHVAHEAGVLLEHELAVDRPTSRLLV